MMFQIGIIPAAGKGTRLSPLPFSKELYPVGFQIVNGVTSPSPISQHLIYGMKQAGIQNLYFIIHPDKSDIIKHYTDGSRLGMKISYLVQNERKGMVDAIAKASTWLPIKQEGLIAFGMPDTLFQPSNLFVRIFEEMNRKPDIDIMLAVFPTNFWYKLGMVFLGESSGESWDVINIQDKPQKKPNTNFAWGAAVWRTSFQNHLTQMAEQNSADGELVLGDVFLSAKQIGMKLRCLKGEAYFDIGTVEELKKVLRFTSKYGHGFNQEW